MILSCQRDKGSFGQLTCSQSNRLKVFTCTSTPYIWLVPLSTPCTRVQGEGALLCCIEISFFVVTHVALPLCDSIAAFTQH